MTKESKIMVITVILVCLMGALNSWIFGDSFIKGALHSFVTCFELILIAGIAYLLFIEGSEDD